MRNRYLQHPFWVVENIGVACKDNDSNKAKDCAAVAGDNNANIEKGRGRYHLCLPTHPSYGDYTYEDIIKPDISDEELIRFSSFKQDMNRKYIASITIMGMDLHRDGHIHVHVTYGKKIHIEKETIRMDKTKIQRKQRKLANDNTDTTVRAGKELKY